MPSGVTPADRRSAASSAGSGRAGRATGPPSGPRRTQATWRAPGSRVQPGMGRRASPRRASGAPAARPRPRAAPAPRTAACRARAGRCPTGRSAPHRRPAPSADRRPRPYGRPENRRRRPARIREGRVRIRRAGDRESAPRGGREGLQAPAGPRHRGGDRRATAWPRSRRAATPPNRRARRPGTRVRRSGRRPEASAPPAPRDPERADQSRRSAMPRPIRAAKAMIDSIGLTPRQVGKIEASAT